MDQHMIDPVVEAARQEQVKKERELWPEPIEPAAGGGFNVLIDGVAVDHKPNRNAALWRHAELLDL